MMTDGLAVLDRIVLAVILVRQRLERTALAFERAGIPYAVLGGNAVFLWMIKHGEGGERFTPNVDFLVNRADLRSVKAALESTGFVADPHRPDLFRDGPTGSPRTRLRLVFAGELVRETDLLANPNISCPERIETFQVLSLPDLVQTKLMAYRSIDRVHLCDMLAVGLIDQTWTARYSLELAERLQTLIDTPDE
jgi:hypothetical protein